MIDALLERAEEESMAVRKKIDFGSFGIMTAYLSARDDAKRPTSPWYPNFKVPNPGHGLRLVSQLVS
jgi:hypothetical protein